VLAEIAERNGDDVAATTQYRAALALDARDRYLRAAYADYLLDHGDAGAARELTADAWTDDNLLLRQALALAGLASPQRATVIATLADRYAAARERGDAVHLREEARFELHLQHDPRRAIELAVANWAIQKEPADARVLLEASLATGDRTHEQVARAWFRRAGVADDYVERLVARSPRAAGGAAS
jgi:Tfp pilus assembly protein PilF